MPRDDERMLLAAYLATPEGNRDWEGCDVPLAHYLCSQEADELPYRPGCMVLLVGGAGLIGALVELVRWLA